MTKTQWHLKHCFTLVVLLGVLGSPALVRSEEDKPADSKRDAEYRRLVVGTWQDNYKGKRTMTVREDGSALMIVELGGLKAGLFASRLEFDMVWSIQNGRMIKKTTGGRPSGRVKMILKTMGDRVNEPILELTQERLLLLDANGKTKYDWRRAPEPRNDRPKD